MPTTTAPRRHTKVAPAAGTPSLPLVATDFNPNEAETHSDRKDVTVMSESELDVRRGIDTINEYAAETSRRWNKRLEKEGKTVFVCPFDKTHEFTTKKACSDHIKKVHPNQLKLAKINKEPKANYEPREKLISPKRRMEDLVPPKFAPAMRAAQESAKQMRELNKRVLRSASNNLTALALIATTEGLAIQRVNELEDSELFNLTRMAFNRSKRRLLKVCRQLCKERDIKLTF